MVDLTLLPAVMGAALVAVATPGPATLAITGTAAEHGAPRGLALAAGVCLGSLSWSVAAAAGLAAAMAAHGWLIEAIRLAGACYLAWLAWGAARRALSPARAMRTVAPVHGGLRAAFLKGLLLHLTNPKAIFFFGALYSVILSPDTSAATLAVVVAAVAVQSTTVFLGYALLFSRERVRRAHAKAARWIDGVAAVLFGAFAVKLLSTRVTP